MSYHPHELRPLAQRRRIYLLRHGDVSYYDKNGNVVRDPDSVPLTEKGQAQAAQLTELLRDVPFDKVIHTGLERTRETARIAAPHYAKQSEIWPGFKEIAPGNIGHLEPSVIINELVYAFEKAAQPQACFAHGERFDLFYERITKTINTLVHQSWHSLLIVAHSGTNRAILSWAINGGLETFAAFEQDPGCLNIIDLDMKSSVPQTRYLRLVNYTPSNSVKNGSRQTSLEALFAQRS